MRKQQYGRIINLSSVVAQIGTIGTTAYAASKAGLWGLTKSLAIENASRNILIDSINLGYMDAGLTNNIPKELHTSVLQRIPLKKFGPISEVILAIDHFILIIQFYVIQTKRGASSFKKFLITKLV